MIQVGATVTRYARASRKSRGDSPILLFILLRDKVAQTKSKAEPGDAGKGRQP